MERVNAYKTKITLDSSTPYEIPSGRGVGNNLEPVVVEMDLTGDSSDADALWSHLVLTGQAPAGNFPELENSARYAIFAADYNADALYMYAVRKNDPDVTNHVMAALIS